MATFRDLQLDWSMLCQDSTDWTDADLQLAAELGKTLLERNKELETALKQHQNIIDDQTQEIEYLTKQTVALREVNDSRLRIYEQLEVSIQDLERANHRLVLENSAEKKHIKSLNTNIETLEAKCEELQSTIDDLRLQVDVLKRRSQRLPETNTNNQKPATTFNLRRVNLNYDDENNTPVSPDSSAPHTDEIRCGSTSSTPRKTDTPKKQDPDTQPESINMTQNETDSGIEQLSQLMAQLRESRSQCSRDERRITELEEQLATIIQQNQVLENQVVQLHHRGEDMKSMHEELTTLEEVRQGQMCSRCLRSVDRNGSDLPEDDDSSMLEELMTSSQHRSSFTMDVQARNLGDILQGEMSLVWISPTANIVSVLVDLCLYIKDVYLIPFLYRPFRFPFIFLHYCLKNKLH